MMFASKNKHIIVPHEKLHPTVKRYVASILSTRRERTREVPGALAFGGILSTILVAPLALARKAPIPVNLAIAAGIAAGGAGISAFHEYKGRSPKVRHFSERIRNAFDQQLDAEPATHLDTDKLHPVSELKESHPFGFVDRKGNVVLVPNTRFQRGLVKAQQTFLKHVLPARYRFKL